MEYECTKESFLNDVKNHVMTIVRDNGEVYRHIKLAEPGNSNYSYSLITWPGHLCISGDCGTYVFSRAHDMFNFFRPVKEYGAMNINPQYWGEKLLAVDSVSGFKKYSEDAFIDCVKRDFRDLFLEDYFGYEDKQKKKEIIQEYWEGIQSQVLAYGENEHDARNAVDSFKHKEFHFVDFWEHDLTEYTYRYIWCLYAIVWGIKQYDEARLNDKQTDK